QPHVEERGKVRVIDAAVIGRIGYDGVEALVFVAELLRVSSDDRARSLDLSELANAVGLVFEGERQAARGPGERVDLREVVDHLECLPVPNRSYRDLVPVLPSAEPRKGIRQSPERHR